MSYEPSHRKPPRQERWPNATPGEGWPAHPHSDRPWESTEAFSGSSNGYVSYGVPGSGNGSPPGVRPAADGYGDPWGGSRGPAADGYGDGFGGPGGGFDGPAGGFEGWEGEPGPGPEFAGPAGYLAPDEYPVLDPGRSPALIAPDTMGDWRQPDQGGGPGRDLRGRGLVVGAVSGLLAAAVTIGVATLAAAFVRPQASPVSAVGAVLIDRLPAAVRSAAAAHLGAHGQTLLLLGAIGLAAVALGCAARRNAGIGVAGLATFGLLGAFVAVTRPASRASDVLPSAIGAAAGIVALLWLVHASAPAVPVRPAYGGGRRRAR